MDEGMVVDLTTRISGQFIVDACTHVDLAKALLSA